MFWLIGGAVAVIGLVTLGGWYFSADQRARRAIKAAAVRTIPDVIEGERARVVGEVELIGSLVAPLSARTCGYWRVIVQERRGGKNKRWVTLVDEHEGVDFFVRDGANKALVKTIHSQAVLEQDAGYSSGFLNDATPELEAFLSQRGHSTQGWVFNKDMRYREGVIEAGETVAVVGTGRWERDPDQGPRAGAGYRDAEMPKRLVLQAPEDGSPLLLSDEPSMTE